MMSPGAGFLAESPFFLDVEASCHAEPFKAAVPNPAKYLRMHVASDNLFLPPLCVFE